MALFPKVSEKTHFGLQRSKVYIHTVRSISRAAAAAAALPLLLLTFDPQMDRILRKKLMRTLKSRNITKRFVFERN